MYTSVKVVVRLVLAASVASLSLPRLASAETAQPPLRARPENRVDHVMAAACARQHAPRIPFRSPARWGWWEEMTGDAPLSTCDGDGQSTMIGAEHIADDGDLALFAGVVEDRRVARGSSRRVGVSFAIPAATLPQWNHTAALLAFDDRDATYRRAGAAVFLSELAIELDDQSCAGEENLFSFVPLPSELAAERWYRLEAGSEVVAGGVVIAASLYDLTSGELLAATAHTFACGESWISRARMAAAFLAATNVEDLGARPEMAIDDYVAATMRPR